MLVSISMEILTFKAELKANDAEKGLLFLIHLYFNHYPTISSSDSHEQEEKLKLLVL